MYALIVNNSPTVVQGSLPDSARRQDTQQWVLGLPTASTALQQATGWFEVTEVAQPADTPTQTTDRTIQKVGNNWTTVWVTRNKTPAEITNATANTNAATIRTQAQNALATNTNALGLPDPTPGNSTYIALSAPSLAQITAQVRAITQQNNALYAQATALTQQNNKLIRLALGLFDGTT